MSGCCVFGCKNQNTQEGLKFYRIPRGSRLFQSNRRRMWLQAIKIGRRKPSTMHACVVPTLYQEKRRWTGRAQISCLLFLCTQNKAREQRQRWKGTNGKGGEMTEYQINLVLVTLQNKENRA